MLLCSPRPSQSGTLPFTGRRFRRFMRGRHDRPRRRNFRNPISGETVRDAPLRVRRACCGPSGPEHRRIRINTRTRRPTGHRRLGPRPSRIRTSARRPRIGGDLARDRDGRGAGQPCFPCGRLPWGVLARDRGGRGAGRRCFPCGGVFWAVLARRGRGGEGLEGFGPAGQFGGDVGCGVAVGAEAGGDEGDHESVAGRVGEALAVEVVREGADGQRVGGWTARDLDGSGEPGQGSQGRPARPGAEALERVQELGRGGRRPGVGPPFGIGVQSGSPPEVHRSRVIRPARDSTSHGSTSDKGLTRESGASGFVRTCRKCCRTLDRTDLVNS